MAVGPRRSWAGNLRWPVAGAWLGGSLMLLAGLVGRAVSLRRLVGDAKPVTDPAILDLLGRVCRATGVRRPVRLRWLPAASSPGTAGLFRPVILLPPPARGWSRTRLELVLVHELTHVSRHDTLTRLVADLACTAVWMHPGVWAAARRLREERERSCDEAVVRHGVPASSYARELLAIARDYRASARPPMLAMARGGLNVLERRINALVPAGRPPRPLKAGPAVALALLVLAPGALLATVGVAVREAPVALTLQGTDGPGPVTTGSRQGETERPGPTAAPDPGVAAGAVARVPRGRPEERSDPGPPLHQSGFLATLLGPVATARPGDLQGESRLGCWATDRAPGTSGGRVVVLFAGRWESGTVRVRLVPERIRGDGAGLASVRVPGMRCWKAPVAGMRLTGEWGPDDVATFNYSAGSELLFATRGRVLARLPASGEPATLECTFAPGGGGAPISCRPAE